MARKSQRKSTALGTGARRAALRRFFLEVRRALSAFTPALAYTDSSTGKVWVGGAGPGLGPALAAAAAAAAAATGPKVVAPSGGVGWRLIGDRGDVGVVMWGDLGEAGVAALLGRRSTCARGPRHSRGFVAHSTTSS
jgi:hypothetical protein